MRLNTRSVNVSATGQIRTGWGVVAGIIVNSHSSGTLRLQDSAGGSAPAGPGSIFGGATSYAFPAGPQTIMFGNPIEFKDGLYATVGGTADLNLLLN